MFQIYLVKCNFDFNLKVDVGERKSPVAMEMKGTPAISPKPPPQQPDQKMRRKRKTKKPVDARYKGFEALLEGEEAGIREDVPLPKGRLVFYKAEAGWIRKS